MRVQACRSRPKNTVAAFCQARESIRSGKLCAQRANPSDGGWLSICVYVVGLLLSLAIGASLGVLGGGGSTLTVPVLHYVFGVDPHAAIAMSLVVVGVTSAAALIPLA